jgi:hypothetical protein
MPDPASPLLDAARFWFNAGFCVIPSHEDGGKRPFGQWKKYQTQRPDWPTLEGWLQSGRYTGIGLIMGQASGNAEMLEIEGPAGDLAGRLDDVVNQARKYDEIGASDLLSRVLHGFTEISAGGGLHTIIRITDGPALGNTKLAHDGNKVIAETRGEGGFVIVWPTAGRTGHEPGAAYILECGGPDTVAQVTSEDRDLLHEIFTHALDKTGPPPPAPEPKTTPPPTTSSTRLSPLDDYAQRVTWDEILQTAGWTYSHTDGTREHWTRPGKNKADGASGNILDGCLYVHSTSVTDFPINKGLSKGQAYAWLHHAGDLSNATRALRAAGYGDPLEPLPELRPWEYDPNLADLDPEDAQAEYVRKHLAAINWRELWDDDTQEEWIVEPLLPARRLVALYSAPKVGKSLLSLELAAGIAAGRPLLGTPAQAPRIVLYVDFENDPVGDTRERLQAMNYTPQDLDNLKLLSFPTLSALDSAKGSEELMAAVRYYNAQVVVIDTVSRAVKGDENENNTWLDFYRMTGLKLKAAGVALIRLDHTGKDQTKGQRGGSAKSGDVDAIWHMTKIDEDTVQLRLDASRFSMPPEMKLLLLHRKENPFRHEVDPNGPRAAFDIKVKNLVAEMDRLNLPKTWGRDKLTQALRDANSQIPRGDGPMREAIKRRKSALTPLVQVISTEQDTA